MVRACGWGRRCRAALRCGSCPPIPRGSLALERRARPAGGDRRPGGVRLRGCSILRGGRARGHSRWRPLRCAGRGPPRAGPRARFGAAPSRFAAHAAALQVRPRRGRHSLMVEEKRVEAFLAPLPVALLRTRPELEALPELLERLGIRTLGEVAAPPGAGAGRALRASRAAGSRSHARARSSLEPRRPPEPVSERLDLPEAMSGQQLERALELLIARVLARRERRGRSLRGLAVSARFVARGPGASRSRCGMRAPIPRASGSPWPRSWPSCPPLRVAGTRGEAFGPPAHDQGRLLDEASAVRRGRLGEAVRQARQAAGAGCRAARSRRGSRFPHPRAPRGAGPLS